jgi:pyrroloquinoline quinone (PQQ) biosynthesis protein C
MRMALFEQLGSLAELELERMKRLPLIQEFATGTIECTRYLEFLRELYPVVWHFCPTMAAAASRCPDRFSAVRSFLYAHAEEEKGHELWVLEDGAVVGGAGFVDQAKHARPCEEIQGMIGFNYAATERDHTCAVLGMVLALEAIAARIAGGAAQAVSKALHLAEPAGVRFLSSHGPMDTSHLAELASVLDGIDDPAAGAAIANAVRVNFRLFSAVFR